MGAPEAAVYDVFDDDNVQLTMLRNCISERKKMPTKEELQATARKEGIALKFSEVAPLIADFRAKLLDAFVERKITVSDPWDTDTTGTLSAHEIKNDKWKLDIWPDQKSRF